MQNDNRLYSLASDTLHVRRCEASIKAKENEIEALKNPKINELDNKRRMLILSSASAMYEGSDPSKFLAERSIIEAEENKLLEKIGLSLADLEGKPVCTKCKDTGFMEGNQLCDCVKQIANKILLERSGLKKVLAKFADSNFALFEEKADEMKKLFSKLQKWAQNGESPYNTLLLSGPTGTGKTFLMQCIASEFINQAKFIYFTSALDLVLACRKYNYSFEDNAEELIEPFLKSEVLFFDDLGTEPMIKNITYEYLLMILNKRQNNNLITIISTNLTPQQIKERYDDRIFSRIYSKECGVAINFEGADLRFKKQ